MVVAGFFAILMIHEAGHLVAAKSLGMKATKYFLGFGPTLWSFQRGETEYGVKAIPAGGYVRIIGMNTLEEVPPEDEDRAYRIKPFWEKSVVVMAGVATHFAVAFVLLWFANVVVGEPDRNRPQLEIAQVLPETEDGSPTAAVIAGIQVGDLVAAVDGVSVANWDELTSILRSRPNQQVTLEVLRDGERLQLDTTLTSRTNPNTDEELGYLGVSPKFSKNRDNPIYGIGRSIGDVALFTRLSAQGIWQFVTNFNNFISAAFSNDEALDEVRPVSVIGITQFGAASQQFGLNVTLELIAYISIFVGLVNTIPLYPFDGGHFAVALYEKVTGRQPDMRKLIPVGAVVFFFIVLVGVLGIYFDIVRPLDLG
ncbi:MAG: RIP metalloprotease [Dehalococcoidia bacterium]|jgi:membrane-associated protease RseP (regulator of RpoE activity)|nr:RIP metalloprotease [Dehalococcoidia bacterium]